MIDPVSDEAVRDTASKLTAEYPIVDVYYWGDHNSLGSYMGVSLTGLSTTHIRIDAPNLKGRGTVLLSWTAVQRIIYT